MLMFQGLYGRHLCCHGCGPENAEEDTDATVFVTPHRLSDSVFDDVANLWEASFSDDPEVAGHGATEVDTEQAGAVGAEAMPGSGNSSYRSSTDMEDLLTRAGPSQARPVCKQLLSTSRPNDEGEKRYLCGVSEEPGECSPKLTCNADECAICLTSLAADEKCVVTLPCGHCLHEACLENMRTHLTKMAAGRPLAAAKCPLCRTPIIRNLDEMVETLRSTQVESTHDLVQAARTLGSVGLAGAEHCDALVRHTHESASADVRCAAVWALGQMGEEVIMNKVLGAVLLQSLADSDAGVREEAQQVFHEAGNLGVSILVAALMQPGQSEVIWQACSDALLPMGLRAARALAEAIALNDGHGRGPAEKCRGIMTLSHLGSNIGTAGTRSLVALLSCSEYPSERSSAASALGNACTATEFEGRSQGIAVLASALADPHESVRQSAVAALNQLGQAAAPHITAMLHVLRHRQTVTQINVLEGLGLMGSLRFAGKPLDVQLQDGILIFPVASQIALARLVKDKSGSIRSATVKTLQQLGVVGAIVLGSQLGTEFEADKLSADTLQQMGELGNEVLKHSMQPQPKKVAPELNQELQISEASVSRAERHLVHLNGGEASSEGNWANLVKSVVSRVELLFQAELRSLQHAPV